MRTNLPNTTKHVRTHGGAPAYPHLKPLDQLRRSVLSALLFENTFYESGAAIAERIRDLSAQVSAQDLSNLAIEARTEHNLRHVPLLLSVELAKKGGKIVADTLAKVLQRADEPAEFLSLYWQGGRKPLSAQIKKGLAKAMQKYDAYQLAKYNRDAAIKLRDVLFMVHAKPKDDVQAANWKKLVDGTLEAPDTWEVALSAGKDKKETFERLIKEGMLGYLALLRNLRNMVQAGVDPALVREAILARKGAQKVLPFRYIAAARHAPQFEPELDKALSATINELPKLEGTTIVLVDVSGSMDYSLSGKSDLKRIDAAAALASVVNAENLRVFSFSNHVKEVAPRRGMAGVDAVIKSQMHGGTALAHAVAEINKLPHDRLIVVTDEQGTDGRVPDPVAKHAYMINVASYQNGVGYGKWTHIDGFSEKVIHFIHEVEKAEIA